MASECDRHYIFAGESHSFFAEAMGLKGSSSVQMFGSSPLSETSKFEDPEFDVCIAAQWRGPPDANAFWRNAKGKTRDFFEDVLYLQDNIETRDTFTAFLASAKHHGVPEREVLAGGPMMRAIYWYARKKERIKLVVDFANSGLKVALIGGHAWNSILPINENITVIEAVGHEELKRWYLKCKSVVTMNNYHGANERVFDAMSAGCLVFCENAPILRTILGDQQAMFYEPNKACDKLEDLEALLSTGLASEMAQRAHENFLAAHTWKHKGEYLSSLFRQFV